ncbi:hypothetical protein H2199_008909 [Coniosporium tulheliwenetii]|uniref:Uncharacterized protein n=1 Tax=Coniosporium tulheliwenetii TaxID=3383036 RepID=A0ACC2YGY2_9PEZI|nr:hypothetical protein H2199_008909 [Cladosporium sp. JES 115]
MATTNALDNLLSDAVSLFTAATSVLAPVYTEVASDVNSILSEAATRTSSSSTPTRTSSSSSSTLSTTTSSSSSTTSSSATSTSATAAPATTSAAAAAAPSSGPNKLAIILGSVLGALLLLTLLALLWFCLRRRRRRRTAGSQITSASTSASVEAWRANAEAAQPQYPLLHDHHDHIGPAPPPVMVTAPQMTQTKGPTVSDHPIFAPSRRTSPPQRRVSPPEETFNTWHPAAHANPFTPVPPPPRRGSDSPMRNSSPFRTATTTGGPTNFSQPITTTAYAQPSAYAAYANPQADYSEAEDYFPPQPPPQHLVSPIDRDSTVSPNLNDVFIPGTVPLVPGAGAGTAISAHTRISPIASSGVYATSGPADQGTGLSGTGRRRSSTNIAATAAAAGVAAAGLSGTETRTAADRDSYGRSFDEQRSSFDEQGRRFSVPRKPLPAIATSAPAPAHLSRDASGGSDDTLIVERPHPLRRDGTPPEVPSRSPRRTRFSDVTEYDDGTRKSLSDLRVELEEEEREERRRGREGRGSRGSESGNWAFGRAY